MFKVFVAGVSLSITALASAAVPEQLWCHNDAGNGTTLSHYFVFEKSSRDVFPPEYTVQVKAIKTLNGDSGDPDAPVGSDDPNNGDAEPIVVLDESYSGQQDEADADLIRFFEGEGSVRIDEGSEPGTRLVTFLRPGDQLPQHIDNCLIPEPGMTVHN